jgi:hypothetical protein
MSQHEELVRQRDEMKEQLETLWMKREEMSAPEWVKTYGKTCEALGSKLEDVRYELGEVPRPTETHRALFAEHFRSEEDEKFERRVRDMASKDPVLAKELLAMGLSLGEPLSIEEHLRCLRNAKRTGTSDDVLAGVLGAPVQYIRAMRAAGSGYKEDS